jgi:hypothetical protein
VAQPLTASLPEALVLDAGYTITLDAVDPTTGAPVAGVVVSNATVTGLELGPNPKLDPPPGPLLTHVGNV